MEANYPKAVFWDYLELCDPKGLDRRFAKPGRTRTKRLFDGSYPDSGRATASHVPWWYG